jgi:hypothetical protein
LEMVWISELVMATIVGRKTVGRWRGDAGLRVGLVRYTEPVMVKSLPGLARQALRSRGGTASPRFNTGHSRAK